MLMQFSDKEFFYPDFITGILNSFFPFTYLAATRPTLGHYPRESLLTQCQLLSLILFWSDGHQEPHNVVGSQSSVEHLMGFALGFCQFWMQHLNPLDKDLTLGALTRHFILFSSHTGGKYTIAYNLKSTLSNEINNKYWKFFSKKQVPAMGTKMAQRYAILSRFLSDRTSWSRLYVLWRFYRVGAGSSKL